MALTPFLFGFGQGLQGLSRDLLAYEQRKREDEEKGIFDQPVMEYQPAEMKALPQDPTALARVVALAPMPTPARPGEPRGVNMGVQRTMAPGPYEVVDRLPKMAPRPGGIALRGGRTFYPELSREGVMEGLRARTQRELEEERARTGLETAKTLARYQDTLAQGKEERGRAEANRTMFGVGQSTGLIPKEATFDPGQDYSWVARTLEHQEKMQDNAARIRAAEVSATARTTMDPTDLVRLLIANQTNDRATALGFNQLLGNSMLDVLFLKQQFQQRDPSLSDADALRMARDTLWGEYQGRSAPPIDPNNTFFQGMPFGRYLSGGSASVRTPTTERGRGGRATGADTLAAKRRTQELVAKGKTPEEIKQTLRSEGLLK